MVHRSPSHAEMGRFIDLTTLYLCQNFYTQGIQPFIPIKYNPLLLVASKINFCYTQGRTQEYDGRWHTTGAMRLTLKISVRIYRRFR